MDKIKKTKQIITGISFFAFPVLFIIGNALHSNLFSFDFVKDTTSWVNEFHRNTMQQTGNLLEFLSTPFLIIIIFSLIKSINNKGASLGIIGGMMAIFGCIIMTDSKGAFCISIAGIDTLPENEFQQLLPAFNALFEKAGMLKIMWALPLLPIGFFIQSIGLHKGKYISKWQAYLISIGALLLANPGIELINLIASLLLATAMFPISFQLIYGKTTSEIKSF